MIYCAFKSIKTMLFRILNLSTLAKDLGDLFSFCIRRQKEYFRQEMLNVRP